ncbi:hypothetical protein [Clostridium perfringens]|uniref:hypothetical protein n=1 Tax=Clostridium perfringens TaxID=1502 RepID=UPI0013E36EF4|nr:hypothetical protein [Clostridium perfringens]MBI6055115.1 hypothetical protein [Clostridium perfringens]MBO3324951.1 hypothetical protein [Clostridium perfringens]MDT7916925.1 hypothetical protein [Clostridium perfringens]MDT7936143.1 hypothetical protein [Clostridium perfringens]MDT7939289.1 hypothetical protein [Clostridium perfringens]
MKFNEVMKYIKQGERYVNTITNDVVRSIEMTEYGLFVDLWQDRSKFTINGDFIKDENLKQIAAEEGLIDIVGYTRN